MIKAHTKYTYNIYNEYKIGNSVLKFKTKSTDQCQQALNAKTELTKIGLQIHWKHFSME